MAKKSNTLNDLTKFLEAEHIALSPDFNVEEDFLEQKPVALVDLEEVGIHIDKIESITSNSSSLPKFVDSKVLKPTSFEDLNDQIKTLALQNNMTVQQIIINLYLQSISSYSHPNMFDMFLNIQKSYINYFTEFQKTYMRKQ
jgi:hypothetical protein